MKSLDKKLKEVSNNSKKSLNFPWMANFSR